MSKASKAKKHSAETQFEQTVDKRRAAVGLDKDHTALRLSELRRDMAHAHRLTLDSVMGVVKTVDDRAVVHTEVIRGIGGGASTATRLVRSNYKSRRERADHIAKIITGLDEILTALQRGDRVDLPLDLDGYIEALRKSVPDRNEFEVVQAKQPDANVQK